MKKVFFTLLLSLVCLMAHAQLKAPKITVKDTLVIMSTLYNNTELAYEDWPATQIIEDAVNIYIAEYTYKKGTTLFAKVDEYLSSWEGHVDAYFYRAVCNGQKSSITKLVTRKDCEDYPLRKYVIDDYSFYVLSRYDYEKILKEN